MKATDEELIMRFRDAKDRDALAELHTRWFPRLYRFLRHLVGELYEEAEDLTQEVLIRVEARAGSFESGSFRAWLFTIARNLAIDTLRKRKRTPWLHVYAPGPEAEEVVPDLSTPEDVAVTSETLEAILGCVAQLPPRLREPLLLKMEGLSNPEIATALLGRDDAQSVQQVGTYLYQARTRLRLELSQRGISAPPSQRREGTGV